MIKIDMEMPNNCKECPCKIIRFGDREVEFYCQVKYLKIQDHKKIPGWCPMIEVIK